MTVTAPAGVPLKPGRAAYIAGLTTPVLRAYARAGRLTRDGTGCYDSAQIRELKAERDRLKAESAAARRERHEERVRQLRERRRAARRAAAAQG